jgi:hypothetical protein
VSKGFLGIAAAFIIGAAGMAAFLKYTGPAKPAESAPAEEEESFVVKDANGPARLELEQDTQDMMGLKTANLAEAKLEPDAKGYGRVLDPSPLVAMVAETATAKASLDASTKEYERVKALAQNQNASARALEAAEAAMKRDQIQYESIQPRLLAGWGKVIASKPDLAAFARSLASQEAALIRVDLPLGDELKSEPTGGRVAALASPDNPAPVEYLDRAADTDPQFQSRGYLFLMKTRPLTPGTLVTAWLTLPGEAQTGVWVPRDAVVRHEGGTFVYLQISDEQFQRQAVVLDRPTPDGWFVRANDHSPLKPKAEVVIVGAQELLSEELKAQSGGEE